MRIEDLGKSAPRRGEPTSSFGVDLTAAATALATFCQRYQSWHSDCTFCRRRHGADKEQLMSTFDNPFDPDRGLRSLGCSCGQHAGGAEHEAPAQLQIRASIESRQNRY